MNNLFVVIDTREVATEDGRKIKQNLLMHKVNIELSVLEVGDYYIPPGESKPLGVVVERKTVLDLINAAKTKRLWDQLQKLANLENALPLLILEGSLNMVRKFTQWKPQSITGLINTILFEFEVPILPSSGWYWTSEYIYNLAKKYQRDEKPRKAPIRIRKKAETPQDHAKIFLSALPSINVARAEAILKRFGSAYEAITNVDQWWQIPNIGKKTIRKVKDVLFAWFKEQ